MRFINELNRLTLFKESLMRLMQVTRRLLSRSASVVPDESNHKKQASVSSHHLGLSISTHNFAIVLSHRALPNRFHVFSQRHTHCEFVG